MCFGLSPHIFFVHSLPEDFKLLPFYIANEPFPGTKKGSWGSRKEKEIDLKVPGLSRQAREGKSLPMIVASTSSGGEWIELSHKIQMNICFPRFGNEPGRGSIANDRKKELEAMLDALACGCY